VETLGRDTRTTITEVTPMPTFMRRAILICLAGTLALTMALSWRQGDSSLIPLSPMSDRQLGEVVGGVTMCPNQAQGKAACNTAPIYFNGGAGASCSKKTVEAGAKLPDYLGGGTVKVKTCFCGGPVGGGCDEKCVSTDYKQWCFPDPGSWCDIDAVKDCTGGTMYTSVQPCVAAFVDCEGSCPACNYQRDGEC
jgi:hypothetical protein